MENINEKPEKSEPIQDKTEITQGDRKQMQSNPDILNEKNEKTVEKHIEKDEQIIEKPIEKVEKTFEEPKAEKTEIKNQDLNEKQINKERGQKYGGYNQNFDHEQRRDDNLKKEKEVEVKERSNNLEERQDKQEIIQGRYEPERQPKQRGYENKGKNYQKYDDRSRYNQPYKSNRPQTVYLLLVDFIFFLLNL